MSNQNLIVDPSSSFFKMLAAPQTEASAMWEMTKYWPLLGVSRH